MSQFDVEMEIADSDSFDPLSSEAELDTEGENGTTSRIHIS
jgi:hypothetical protein